MFEACFLRLVVLIHTLFLLFVCFTPFLGNNYFLCLHLMAVPFMMIHWVMNDNNCALTLLEANVRRTLYGVMPRKNDCFIHKIIAPIYDFNDDHSVAIYASTISLWFISFCRLWYNRQNGRFNGLQDLLKY